ncbi:Vacuolar protein 8 [Bienertia sinuspersici]
MSVIVHYRGSWQETPSLIYVGGTTKIFDDLLDDLNSTYCKNIINSLGYEYFSKLHYCDPMKFIDVGVRFLSYDDATFVRFLSLMHMYRVMDFFIEHEVDSEDELLGLNGRSTFTSLLTELIAVDEIDYDDEGSDNEYVEVVHAREQLKSSQKAEKELED